MKNRNHHFNSTIPDRATVVAAFRQSGLSLKEFAREQGIRPSRLHYWVYQKGPASLPKSLAKAQRAGPMAVFPEVKLEAGSKLLPSWAAEVSLARGLSIRFSGTARPDWIGAVMQALQRPC